jgi:hypothetical protein
MLVPSRLVNGSASPPLPLSLPTFPTGLVQLVQEEKMSALIDLVSALDL